MRELCLVHLRRRCDPEPGRDHVTVGVQKFPRGTKMADVRHARAEEDLVDLRARDLGEEACEKITEGVRMSIEHSIRNPDAALEFAIKWGRGIDEETNAKFVQMYVNERTIDYGEDGRSSIRKFLKDGQKLGMIDPNFVPDNIDFIGSR